MTTQYNQGAPLYNVNNNVAQQIPSIVFSTSSNSYQNITVPPQNIVKISTIPATSMTKMSNFTTTIETINANILAALNIWNNGPNSPKPPNSPNLAIQSQLSPLNGTENYFENGNQVMDFHVFGHLFFSNGSKRSHPNYYFSNIASFNTNCLTYSNSVSNYNPISLSNLLINQICINNNIGLSSLDSNLVIDLHNNLKNYTNLSNLIGNYRCLDIEALYNSFTGFGFVKYDLDNNNINDAKPNIYGGVLIQLINSYNIYVSVPNIASSSTTATPPTTTTTTTPPTATPPTTTPTTTPPTTTPGIDNYLIQIDVPYLTYFGNLVSQSQFSSSPVTNPSQTSGLSVGSTVSGFTLPSLQQISSGSTPIGYQSQSNSNLTPPVSNP
jgi:hypothetical protein